MPQVENVEFKEGQYAKIVGKNGETFFGIICLLEDSSKDPQYAVCDFLSGKLEVFADVIIKFPQLSQEITYTHGFEKLELFNKTGVIAIETKDGEPKSVVFKE